MAVGCDSCEGLVTRAVRHRILVGSRAATCAERDSAWARLEKAFLKTVPLFSSDPWAASVGPRFLNTNVSSTNARMLELNEKIGFRPYRIQLRKRI